MTTKREQILEAITNQIQNAVTPVNVYRSRINPFNLNKENGFAITIEPVNETMQDITVRVFDWTLNLSVYIYSLGDIPEQETDSIYSQVFSAILSDITLGGLSMNLLPTSTTYERFQGEQEVGVTIANFAISYRTQSIDLTA